LRLKNARVEKSSMLTASSEADAQKGQGFKVSKVSMFQGVNFETLKLCNFETWFFAYLRMPSLVMTVL
jgi:hypothetical protein